MIEKLISNAFYIAKIFNRKIIYLRKKLNEYKINSYQRNGKRKIY